MGLFRFKNASILSLMRLVFIRSRDELRQGSQTRGSPSPVGDHPESTFVFRRYEPAEFGLCKHSWRLVGRQHLATSACVYCRSAYPESRRRRAPLICRMILRKTDILFGRFLVRLAESRASLAFVWSRGSRLRRSGWPSVCLCLSHPLSAIRSDKDRHTRRRRYR